LLDVMLHMFDYEKKRCPWKHLLLSKKGTAIVRTLLS